MPPPPEPLDRLTITVNSPDGGLTAALRERGRLSLSFKPGRFDHYTESTLEPQLARLASFTWVGWQRGRERFDVEATGSAVGGAVCARTRGLREWEFTLEPGCLRSLGETGSAEAIVAAVAEAVIAYEVRAEELKRGADRPAGGDSRRRD